MKIKTLERAKEIQKSLEVLRDRLEKIEEKDRRLHIAITASSGASIQCYYHDYITPVTMGVIRNVIENDLRQEIRLLKIEMESL